MKMLRGWFVVAIILISASGTVFAETGVVLDSSPAGFCTTVYSGNLSNLRVDTESWMYPVSMCDAQLDVRPGETVYLKATVTNTRYSDPTSYLLLSGKVVGVSSPLPNPTFSTDEFPVAHPGDSFEYTLAGITIPSNTPVGISFFFCAGIDGCLVDNNGTNVWNVKTQSWEARPTVISTSDHTFVMGRVFYTLTVVPEPSTVLALLTGLTGAAGVALRRRKA